VPSTPPPLPPLAGLLGRVAATTAAAVSAPLQRGSRRNAREAIASDRMRARARLESLGEPAADAVEPAQNQGAARTNVGA
jgi:hypothetical protein